MLGHLGAAGVPSASLPSLTLVSLSLLCGALSHVSQACCRQPAPLWVPVSLCLPGFCFKVWAFLLLLRLLREGLTYTLEVGGNPALSKSMGTVFPTAFTHFSVPHFGNSHNISDLFIIIFAKVFVISDL